MGVSFRKSIRIGKNTRINISEHGGIGFSTGIKGFRISRNRMGTRITIGRGGVLYTKFFGKKKKRKAKKGEQVEENKPIINEETVYERVPTDDEAALLYLLGNKDRNYILYGLTAIIIALLGVITYNYNFFKEDLFDLGLLKSHYKIWIGFAFTSLVFLFYIVKSKHHKYIRNINRAISLYNRDKLQKAYKKLKKALTHKPEGEKALMLMIFTAFELEQYEETIKRIEEFKVVDEDEPIEVMYFIEGVSKAAIGQYKEAIRAIEHVYSEEDAIKNSKYKVLGDCHFGLQDFDTAIRWYGKLPVRKHDMTEDLVEYKYALGRACLFDGNEKRAFTYLSKVYDYNPDYKDIRELMKQL
ncbi:DUF4236 domain-containing protein [Haloplasma contractile]|uniref:Tetratricopeptide repeat protein n=1 Tax=Haloplasma contractile SSD-17B TaxID=1033810 RepID=U2EG55_9MOLU|nr:DUF4236 domain-containing protein [Haloplasma contractile]ERJ13888.1 Tetratricopeptide repeat protein [Haloplasma contractile SSD-17B]